ncbi:endolytic transglycosylase MltG [Robertmurraya sp. DFI.2.37]|uniref:endolytic transglycosylase MltG n=1 Tax=Robertmurraya TaxID=2837507 RepID=UPI0010F8DECA|nr:MULTISPECIES: endolytic transglycosylase MltG [Robertmurraya]MDF1508258.1 endolytic transglycosylase MltG [Robertmurraya sp. DFI.2.37]
MASDEKKSKKEYMREKMIERQQEAKVVRKIVFIISSVLFLLIGGTLTGGYFYIKNALQPVDPDSKTEKKVEIPIGSSVTGISQILEENGIIKDAKVFKYYVKFKNESEFMAGEYSMTPAMTFPEIIESLKTGKIEEEVVFKITIPEGKQLSEIATIIGEKTDHDVDEVFAQLNDEAFINKMMQLYPNLLTNEIFNENIKYPLEGYLFPATYPYYKEDPSIEEIVTVMLAKSEEVIEQYTGPMAEMEYTPHQLLTMASLIEEEATEQVERDQIASVFYNRMDIDMPLQTDPTVLYALGEHKDRVLYEDLEVNDPYNTYKNKGLTPGPIANAGVSSIEAALYPAETDFLYFLATGAGDVLFSKTLDEHNRKKAEHITN